MKIELHACMKNALVREWRLEQQLTQAEAGMLVGLGPSAWSAIECMNFKVGSYPAAEKIADAIGCSVDEIYPPELKSRHVGRVRVKTVELEHATLVALERQTKRLTMNPAEMAEEAEDRDEMKDRLRQVLDTLPRREREIIELRYDLNGDGHTYTLKEVGKIFGITRERVRMIEAKAIRKLQDPVRSDKLVEFVPPRRGPP